MSLGPRRRAPFKRLADLAARRADAARETLARHRRAHETAVAAVREARVALEGFRAKRTRIEADLRVRQLGRVQMPGELSRFIGRLDALKKQEASLREAVATACNGEAAAEASVREARRELAELERAVRKWETLCGAAASEAVRRREHRAEDETDEVAALCRPASTGIDPCR